MKYGDVVKMRTDAEDFSPEWARTRVMVIAVFEEAGIVGHSLVDGVIVMDSKGNPSGRPLLFAEYEWEVI